MKLVWFALCAVLSLASRAAPAAPVRARLPLAAEPHKVVPVEIVVGAEVLVLHATHDKKGVDPQIGALPELAQTPFSSFEGYALLDRTRLPLSKSEPRELKLPNGRTLELRLRDAPQKDSVRLSASINQPRGKDFLPLLEVKAKPGQAFIVAGQSYKRGILVLVIRIVK
ncbi:MAG TPA: hypothetical protein VGI10_08100 [Polyangiaceae bacterium]